LTRGKVVLLATKFRAGPFAHADSLPHTLEPSLGRLGRRTVDLYQHHFPSPWIAIPHLMELMTDAVEAGKLKAVGVSNSTSIGQPCERWHLRCFNALQGAEKWLFRRC